MNAKKRSFNWLFWLLAVGFLLIDAGFFLSFLEKTKGGMYASYHYPWQDLLEAFLFLVAAGLFIAKNRAGWYLIVGYFCFTVLFALLYPVGSALYYSSWETLAILLESFVLLLLLTAAVLTLMFLPRIRKDVFGIAGRGIVLKIALAAIIVGIVTALAPWGLGSI